MNPNDPLGQQGQSASDPTHASMPPQWPGAPIQQNVQPVATPSQYTAPVDPYAPPQNPAPPFAMPDMTQFDSAQMAMPQAHQAPQMTAPPAPPLPTPPEKHDHPMVVLQPGERIVAQIKRHPIGLIGNYMSGGLVMLLAAAAAVFLVPRLTQNVANATQIQNGAYAVLLLLLVGVAAMLALASKVYWQNEWVITSDSITQISQISLFSRQSAQLSMENLEDVTVDQNGIVQHSLNFGTLHVETAGEHSKFVFPYCPNPTYYARVILQAREDFVNHKQYEVK